MDSATCMIQKIACHDHSTLVKGRKIKIAMLLQKLMYKQVPDNFTKILNYEIYVQKLKNYNHIPGKSAGKASRMVYNQYFLPKADRSSNFC